MCCLYPVVSVSVFSSIPVGFPCVDTDVLLSAGGTCVLGLLLMQTESVFPSFALFCRFILVTDKTGAGREQIETHAHNTL